MSARPGSADPARAVERTYLVLTLLTTLASSFIWGINTIFLLDAGLSNAEAFAANAFFTVGQVIFEVPTGVVADTRGRQLSYVLGAGTLLVSTLLYLVMWQVHAPLWGWAIASILLGLGFTFFSGATEAWLVDALKATGFTGHLEHIFGRAQVVGGVAMLVGTVSGGVIAQATNLGVPYLIRAAMLGVTMLVAIRFMRDLGFTPQRDIGPLTAVRNVVRGSIDGGFRNPPVRWLMLAAPFTVRCGHLRLLRRAAVPPRAVRRQDRLRRRGPGRRDRRRGPDRRRAHRVPGPAPLRTPDERPADRRRAQRGPARAARADRELRRRAAPARGLGLRVRRRSAAPPGLRQRPHPIGATGDGPVVRHLMGSAGGVIAQPALGRVADVNGYGAAYIVSAGIQALALPFVLLARRENAVSDPIGRDGDPEIPAPVLPAHPGHVPIDGD